jgi:dTDP-4-dehydrorhamnose reductase
MKVLLFGSTGMLGKYVYNILKDEYNVICIKRNDFDIENDNWYKLYYIIESNLNENDVIINCAGIIPQKYEDDSYKPYIRVNTLFPHKLNEMSKKNNYKFIHITTDCVYDGLKGNYSVNDNHSAKNIYGISKSQGEPEEATVIRTSIIGPELNSSGIGLLHWFLNQKNDINGYTFAFWSGVTTLELAKFINVVLTTNFSLNGVFHLTNNIKIDKHSLLKHFQFAFKKNKLNIIPNGKYKIDKSLINTCNNFNYTVPSYETMINDIRDYIIYYNSLYNYEISNL